MPSVQYGEPRGQEVLRRMWRGSPAPLPILQPAGDCRTEILRRVWHSTFGWTSRCLFTDCGSAGYRTYLNASGTTVTHRPSSP